MKFAAVLDLAKEACPHQTADRTYYRPWMHAEKFGDRIQARVALTGFAVEVIDEDRGNALVVSQQRVGQIDHLMSNERIKSPEHNCRHFALDAAGEVAYMLSSFL